ncbi:hypothetical protein [Paraburkholderia acidisoli]|uniref:NAD(P) transhydrogenase beta subunit n=1 Tax=Paraburkholderia acidisoli TaxID=2571748 RepID=A0A7Z2GLB4_9BURK|nr:hypothetical protein [Paraburkholderia acidisoli]QGZ63916.1 hypothetical protein FAZ98_19410 [Paraburkholderia acidisoli]
MPEQLAVDLAWLGGGATFAWLICAFAQLAACAPLPWARARIAPRCASAADERDASRRRRLVLALFFALLLTAPPGVIAGCSAHAIQASIAVEAGAMAGLIYASRFDFTRRVRAVARCAGALSSSVIAGAFVLFFLRPELAAGARVALFAAVASSAVLAGGAFGVFAGSRRIPHRGARIAFHRGDAAMYGIALSLGIALGCAFVSAQARPEFGVSVLIGASVLGAALGARLMSGTHHSRRLRLRMKAKPLQERWRTAFQASFADVSDEWLVAACGGGTFAPAWLPDIDDSNGGARRAHLHTAQETPRRRRRSSSRRGAPRQRQAPD